MELTFDLIYASLKGENAALREAYTEQQALILQLVEALEGYRRNHNDNQPCDAERAGRAQLGRPHD